MTEVEYSLSTTNNQTSHEVFKFLDLPREIRDMIYAYALHLPSGFPVVEYSTNENVERVQLRPHPLMLVCKVIRGEASQAFPRCNWINETSLYATILANWTQDIHCETSPFYTELVSILPTMQLIKIQLDHDVGIMSMSPASDLMYGLDEDSSGVKMYLKLKKEMEDARPLYAPLPPKPTVMLLVHPWYCDATASVRLTQGDADLEYVMDLYRQIAGELRIPEHGHFNIKLRCHHDNLWCQVWLDEVVKAAEGES